MKINIVLPFPDAAKAYTVWAKDENSINFFTDHYEAARCTAAFAAKELVEHLSLILINPEIGVSECGRGDCFNVIFRIDSFIGRGEEYSLIPVDNGIILRGNGRVGVLYAAYELLKIQGVMWLEPGEVGRVLPKKHEALIIPDSACDYRTTSPIGRGYSVDGRLNESEDLFLFMARNRLNVYFNFPNCARMMKKLGFILRDGGHIFEAILNPRLVMPSGKTLFEEHTEWFGLPANGQRRLEDAQRTQFCVCEDGLLEYLAEELFRNVMGRWKEAEEINVWGFDTWGGICTCERCKKLGNAADQNLKMASYFRDYLNEKRKCGELDRDVRMVLCAYEGSSTLTPPENPTPKNLIEAGDHWLFAPITRCYAHTIYDEECSYNREYYEKLVGWAKYKDGLPVSMLEYYNVSKFEDLPLLFIRTMKKDIRHYSELGLRGMCYMHVPMVNWGVRALTNVFFAALSWDAFADTDELFEKYLAGRYGEFSDVMREVYLKIDEATASITSWRAWKRKSLLSKLNLWNGKIPTEPLAVDDHFGSPQGFEKEGERILGLLESAMEKLQSVIRSEKCRTDVAVGITDAKNPAELLASEGRRANLQLLLDDKRGLIYGIDSYRAAYLLGCYYNALYNGDTAKANLIWNDVEAVEEKLESYYLPATYTYTLIAMISKDALTRTQLGDVIMRARNFRLKNGGQI